MSFTRAIVRPPAPNFAHGLTTVDLGTPDYALALQQHAAYCRALQHCGLQLIELPADARYPDSTFVEDTAILTAHGALITRPGAVSRAGEIAHMRATLAELYPTVAEIQTPGTVDGGDICEAGHHFFIGLSERTNLAGGQQLATWLEKQGYTASLVDIRGVPGILHLKSGIAALAGNKLALIETLANHPAFDGWEKIRVPAGEDYAANCVQVNARVLVAMGYPKFTAQLMALGYAPLALEMSEYRKMDGGLSCLSLRF
jgi:dimethylargininase